VGNRAFGERLAEFAPPEHLRAAVEILLLAPSPPLLFMGEEWGATTRFPFFCDFQGELRQAVTEGRRQEFARFDRFRDPKAREAIPDACAPATFLSAKLRWEDIPGEPHPSSPFARGRRGGGEEVNSMKWLSLYRKLLRLRRVVLIPRLTSLAAGGATYALITPGGLHVRWPLTDDSLYELFANLGDAPIDHVEFPAHRPLYASPGLSLAAGVLPPWTVAWFLESGVD
jgi:1,4-alpha-glucan branching enzyme